MGTSDGDGNEEKIWLDTYQGVMQGLHAASCMLSDGYQWACLEVQDLVSQSLDRSTQKDHNFMAKVSTVLCQWVQAVQPAIDCLNKNVAERSCLLEAARKAGMQITKDILGLYSLENKEDTIDPLHNLTIWTFNVAQRHVEDACTTLHLKLPALVHQHKPASF